MPISSAEISQLNGSFTQQYAMQMQYAGMIGQHGPMGTGRNPYVTGESVAGTAMNRGMAIGAPLATAGLSLMGLDPLSLAMRGGMSAYGAGAGFGGAAMAGAAVAAPMALGLGAASYMGNQMMMGARQVQGFNQDMRGSYNFGNPNTPGGRGFGQTDLREIGGVVRSMAGTGEQGFDELGRLASQMGRMGMADGVRNAKDFSEKFREMMKTVKTISQEMTTSLEEAQTMMASMRGSGIFNKQGAVAQRIRSSAAAGGLATTEVTGMMNVGSQISRMYGGTGRAGAMGGMEAITQIGAASQSGVLSEEDIYNATGLTGAEGRRSLAMNQLQGTGQFLKSGKGRYFLASVAGKDGQLDQSSVSNWMAGGMSVDDTRRQAHENLSKVGRANFIRNEGRLRGSVMEQFGGLAPAMAMMQWANGKGIDINDMDDRSMLFAQRQLGMGRDEADVAMKMARRLPELLKARRESGQDAMFARENAERAKMSGLEGVKTRFDKARNSINNEMQKAGQDIMNVASETITRWANRLADNYEERSIEGIRETWRSASMGGAGGARLAQQLLGGGGPKDKSLQGLLKGAGGVSDSDAFGDVGQQAHREKTLNLKFQANMGEFGSLSSAGKDFVSKNKDFLRSEYADGIAGLGGEDRIAAVQKLLKSRGGGAYDEFKGMSAGKRAAFVQRMEREMGIGEGVKLGDTFQDPGMAELRGLGGAATANEFHEQRGRELLGKDRSLLARGADFMGQGVTQALGIGIVGASAAMGAAKGVLGSEGFVDGLLNGAKRGVDDTYRFGNMGGDMIEELNGGSKSARGASQFLGTSEGRSMVFGMMQGDKDALENARTESMRLLSRTARGEKLTDEEMGRLGIVQRAMISSDFQKIASAAGGIDKMQDGDWDKLVERTRAQVAREGGDPNSVTRDTVKNNYRNIAGAANEERKTIISRIASQTRKSSQETQKELLAGGIAQLKSAGSGGREQLFLSDRLAKQLGKDSKLTQAAQMALDIQDIGSRVVGRADTAEADAKLLEQQRQLNGRLYDSMGDMSVTQLKALARSGVDGGVASEQLMLGNRMRAGVRKRGAAGAIANELGIDLNADDLAGMKGLSAEERAARMSGKLGGTSDEFRKQLAEAISAADKGPGGAQKAASLLHRAVAQADPETKKKLMEAQGKGPDPLEKIADKIGDGNKFLEALVKSNDAAKHMLTEIANNSKKDGEANP